MKFKAIRVRTFEADSKWWKKGSELFKLVPPSDFIDGNGALQNLDYVVVAFTPQTIDHGKPEATLYPSTAKADIRDFDSPDETWIAYEPVPRRMNPYDYAEIRRCRCAGNKATSRNVLHKFGYEVEI